MPKDAHTTSSLDEHAVGLRAWAGRVAGGEVTREARHAGGSHRIAWQVDVAVDDDRLRELFLTLDAPDAGGEDGNRRDGAVLAALRETSVPVPGLVGREGPGGALLMERIAGRSDAPVGPDLEPVMTELMGHMAALHGFGPDSLDIPELPRPKTSEALALDQLSAVEAAYRETPGAHQPLIDFGLGWLRRHVPSGPVRPALVHGDIGPGNLIYAAGRVQAIVDWEIAHWGDPMEDVAALSVRDMATPVGSFARRVEQYEAAVGEGVDSGRLRYYRVLVLVRNSLLIALTLAQSPPSQVPAQLGAFALLLRRAATQALAEASGVAWGAGPGTSSLPDAPMDEDGDWIPALASQAIAACEAERELLGPLADRTLQAVPER
jgi:aminoglycoside phosphotransferase (APT) family kinase protein